MIQQRWRLEELRIWAQQGWLDERVFNLLRPHLMLWPRDERELTRSFAFLHRALPSERRHLLPQALVAAALTQPGATPSWILPWLKSEMELRLPGCPLPWDTLFSMRWALVPIALAEEKRGVIYWVLVGRRLGEPLRVNVPCWWFEAADENARKSVEIILKLLAVHADTDFFFWPLLPFVDRKLICGSSLALPFYLAAYGLGRECSAPGILATGKIEADGSLAPAGGLKAKAAAAAREGIKAFLHPRPGAPTDDGGDLLEVLEVETLQEACFLWELYEPGNGAGLVADLRSLTDPRRLAANAHLFSLSAVRSKAFIKGYTEKIQAVLEETDLAHQFLDNLERTIEKPDQDVRLIDTLLVPISPERVRVLSGRDPLSAFRLVQLQLLYNSRQGRFETSELWAHISSDLVEKVATYDHGLDLKAAHLNRQIVLERHGRYDFRPELPEQAVAMIDLLKSLDCFKRQHSPGTVAMALGKIYGTVAQNFGFCGPAYLSEVEKYVALAQEAFGGGLFQVCIEDWRRQFCYLLYALLDAGQRDEARKALGNYIEIPLECCNEDLFNEMNPYQHAALSRFLADTHSVHPDYAVWCRRQLHDRPRRHPWGLWLTNVGRFSKDPEIKEAAWDHALETCLGLGITARAMGLLPIAYLWTRSSRKDSWLEHKTGLIMHDLTSSPLSREHFSCLFRCGSWQEVLGQVLDRQALLFPFTYR
jgi:hypothetical protein